MASGILHWNLFNGFQDKAKQQQAKLEKLKLHEQIKELQDQIRLQVREACENIKVTQQAIVSAQERVKSAEEAYYIVSKKYQTGMVPQIEYIDSRVTLTNADINQAIVKYDLEIKQAELDRVLAEDKID